MFIDNVLPSLGRMSHKLFSAKWGELYEKIMGETYCTLCVWAVHVMLVVNNVSLSSSSKKITTSFYIYYFEMANSSKMTQRWWSHLHACKNPLSIQVREGRRLWRGARRANNSSLASERERDRAKMSSKLLVKYYNATMNWSGQFEMRQILHNWIRNS